MLAVFRKKATGGPSFTAAYFFVLKFFAGPGYFTNEHFIAHDPFFWVRALEDEPFTIKTKIRFGIVATESKLLDIFEMFFAGIKDSV